MPAAPDEEWNGVPLKGHGLLLLSESGLYKLTTRSDKPEEKATATYSTPGGNQKTSIVSESGLYKITLRAQRKNPIARDFQDWVSPAAAVQNCNSTAVQIYHRSGRQLT